MGGATNGAGGKQSGTLGTLEDPSESDEDGTSSKEGNVDLFEQAQSKFNPLTLKARLLESSDGNPSILATNAPILFTMKGGRGAPRPSVDEKNLVIRRAVQFLRATVTGSEGQEVTITMEALRMYKSADKVKVSYIKQEDFGTDAAKRNLAEFTPMNA